MEFPKPAVWALFACLVSPALGEEVAPALGFEEQALLLRESVLLRVEPRLPTSAPHTPGRAGNSRRYPWKNNIVTTVFWIGETPTANNPVPNNKSSWDTQWLRNYGGYDDPDPRGRRGYLPARFVPRQNPFYIALPYNDVSGGRTKPEVSRVIPWFRETFSKQGESVCKSRWVVIRHRGKEAYAQWEDCGPFRTDHWQYVFGTQRPLPNLNQGAGLDVSPAVRDYLRMDSKDVADWRFVEFSEVPRGPWAQYGENNTFVQKRRGADVRFAETSPSAPASRRNN
ncbi:MAG: hypothetical protein JHC52_07230 [Chthoniobacterales bacterium]|jgi:hypothetical protein|nr:hypothetical protein [Chthoniobacterales bacterium]